MQAGDSGTSAGICNSKILPTFAVDKKHPKMKLPETFVTYTRALLGDEGYAAFEAALLREPLTSLRLNPEKTVVDAASSAVRLRPVPWASGGYYADERPTFTFDPLFHAGCYYVQEASSMFVEQVLRRYVDRPVVALDLCAAPGGKSTHVRSLLPEGSLLVSNEVMRSRIGVLAENLVKWGHPDVVVTHADPAEFTPLKATFDVILTDVPCSGEGMFRKDAVAVDEWSTDNVALCWQRQRRILTDIWPCLKPGGLIIYSTCTYNIYEDEDNVAWLRDTFGAEPLAVPVSPDWGITGDLSGCGLPVYRFLPHHTAGEGFFLAVLRKPDGEEEQVSLRRKKERKGKTPAVPTGCRAWLREPDAWEWTCDGEQVAALPRSWKELVDLLRQHLRVISAGVRVGEVKGKDLVPSHALAMSTARADAFPTCELDYAQAIAYLRKEALQLPPDASRGYVLVTYRGIPLGFVKSLGSRANNLYPAEWRIRSTYLPDTAKCL